ncbi:hypothetical protein MMC22_004361 [Lobaria immixta]|nr:hypothetical protein [Lobaria immixta]
MIEKLESTEPLSTLEVVDRYSIVCSLERDHATNAPELDEAAYAPQAAFDPEQKIPINHSLPEAINESDDGLQVVDDSYKSHFFGLSRKVGILVLILVTVVILAAAGIGIGVGVTNKETRSPPPPASTPTQTIASTSEPDSQPTVASASDYLIRSDSSLAALTVDGGDRTLFFQDRKGMVRQTIYENLNKRWSITPSPIVASGARNFTPLALAHNPNTTDDVIHLFYIAASNNLAFVIYDFSIGLWSNHTELVDSGGLPFRAATNSRRLLAKRLGNSTPTLLQVLIHYENADGNVTVLEGLNNPPSGAWAVQDITKKLSSSLRPQGSLRAPCSSIRVGNAVRLVSTEQVGVNPSENFTIVTADYEDDKFNSTFEKYMFDPISIGDSDVQLASNASQIYGFWVNGTSLASFSAVHSSSNVDTLPDSSFPHVRLAGINPNPGHVYFLYNQISLDTFVENQFDFNLHTWTPSKINITEI